jgi:hypothetical protein
MPTLTPTLPQLGRIRAGDQVATKNGQTRPHRLERFRLTSQNKPLLHTAVELGYGEEVIEWPNAPEGRQWQVYCTVDSLPVIVPSLAAFSQYDELWEGSECVYRCDGATVVKSSLGTDGDGIVEGMPCMCAQFADRVPTVTRVSLFLPDMPGIGVWRLDTRGFYAGSELQGIVLMLQDAAQSGMMVPAELSITQRRQRKNKQTRVFPVIALQPREMTMGQVLQLQQPPTAKHIAAPSDVDVYPADDRHTAFDTASRDTGYVPVNRETGEIPLDETDAAWVDDAQPGLGLDAPQAPAKAQEPY